MLTIENTHKLFRRDVGEWRIGRIEEATSAYLIQLNKPNGNKMQINLERLAINNGFGNDTYELWMWSKQNSNGVANTAVPKRIMVLIDTIKDMNKLVDTIKFLITN